MNKPRLEYEEDRVRKTFANSELDAVKFLALARAFDQYAAEVDRVLRRCYTEYVEDTHADLGYDQFRQDVLAENEEA